jgi:hypothetical protein
MKGGRGGCTAQTASSTSSSVQLYKVKKEYILTLVYRVL